MFLNECVYMYDRERHMEMLLYRYPFKCGFFEDVLEKSILFDEQKHTV